MEDKVEKIFLDGVGRNSTTTLEQFYGNSVVVRRRYKTVWYFTIKDLRDEWSKELEATSMWSMVTTTATQHFSFNLGLLGTSPNTAIPCFGSGHVVSTMSHPDFCQQSARRPSTLISFTLKASRCVEEPDPHSQQTIGTEKEKYLCRHALGRRSTKLEKWHAAY
jgi:hypothetical protein